MSDWGYLGDDSWQNPSVEIELNPLGAGEGVVIAKKKESKFNKPISVPYEKQKVALAIKRPLTQGEQKDVSNLQKQKAATAVKELLTKPAALIPKVLAAMNPVAAAAAVAKPMMMKQQVMAKAEMDSRVADQKIIATNEWKNTVATIKNAVAAGTTTPQAAESLARSKLNEIKAKDSAAMKTIKEQAIAKVSNAKQIQAKITTALVKKQGIALDQNRQKLEAEIRKVSTSAMPPGAKAEVLKTLQSKAKGMDIAKAEVVKRKEIATVNQMAAKGVLPMAAAKKLATDIGRKADALKTQRLKVAKASQSADQMKGRLYLLGKWIQAYTSAIQFAQQAGATSVVIPVGDMALSAPQAKAAVTTIPSKTVTTPSKVVITKAVKKPVGSKAATVKGLGSTVFQSYPSIGYISEVSSQPNQQISKEVRMPVQTAKAKLEKFKMEYAALEKKLAGNAGAPGLPLPKILPVTQTGQPVTPELLKAQETFIRQGIATGKMNAVVGAQAVKQLQQVGKLMQATNKPVLAKTAQKPRPTMIIQVFISPEAVNQIRTGERMVTTSPGKGKTQAVTPKEQIPSAIPFVTAKTTGTVTNIVKTQPARPPAVSPARPATVTQTASKIVGSAVASKPTMMAPAATIQKPGAITGKPTVTVKKGRAQGKTIGMPKNTSLTELINQMIPW